MAARFANVKLISQINISGWTPEGYAEPGSSGIVLAEGGLNGLTAVHEFGHTAGLEHRDDAAAIMRSPALDGKEVNRSETNYFCAWHPQRWDE